MLKRSILFAAQYGIVSATYPSGSVSLDDATALTTSVQAELDADLGLCYEVYPYIYHNVEFTDWLEKNMLDYTRLEEFVHDKNIWKDALMDTSCQADTVSDCVGSVNTNASFKMSATAVLTGFLGFAWLFIMVPCAITRRCRFCESSTGRTLSRGEWSFINFFFVCSLLAFFVTVGYLSHYRQDVSQGVKYGLCATQKAVEGVGATVTTVNTAITEMDASITSALSSWESTYFTGISMFPLVDNNLQAVEDFVTTINTALTDYSASLPTGYHNLMYKSCCSTTSTNIVDTILPYVTGDDYQDVFDTWFTTVQSSVSFTDQVEQLTYTTAVGSQIISDTIIDHKTTLQNAPNMIRRASLAMAILMMIPLLCLFASVFVISQKVASPSYRDPRIRPNSSKGAALSWCLTMTYAFITLSIAAAIFSSSYMISAACLIGRDMADDITSYSHLYNDKYGETAADGMASLLQGLLTVDDESSDYLYDMFTDYRYQSQTVRTTIVDAIAAVATTTAPTFASLTVDEVVDDLWVTFKSYGTWVAADSTLLNSGNYLSDFTTYNTTTQTTIVGANSALYTAYQMNSTEYDTMYDMSFQIVSTCDSSVTYSSVGTDPLFQDEILSLSTSQTINTYVNAGILAGVFPSGITCDGLLTSTNDFSTDVPDFLPFSQFLQDFITIAKADFTYPKIGGVTDSTTCGYVANTDTFTITTGTAAANGFAAAYASDSVQSNWATVKSQLSSFNTQLGSLISTALPDLTSLLETASSTVTNYYIYNTVLKDYYYDALDATCQTAAPAFIILGIGCLIFGIAAMFAVFVEFLIWRRMVDNYSLWDDVRRNAAIGGL